MAANQLNWELRKTLLIQYTHTTLLQTLHANQGGVNSNNDLVMLQKPLGLHTNEHFLTQNSLLEYCQVNQIEKDIHRI